MARRIRLFVPRRTMMLIVVHIIKHFYDVRAEKN